MNRNRNDNPARGQRRDTSDANLKVVTTHAVGLSQSVLRADVAGMPLEWIDYKEAARLYHQDQVAYACGSPIYRLHGGYNARSGRRTFLNIRNPTLLILSSVTYSNFVTPSCSRHFSQTAPPRKRA